MTVGRAVVIFTCMTEPPMIDHDANEERPEGPWPWIKAWLFVGALWVGFLWLNSPRWLDIGLGFATGAMFAYCATDITDNRYIFSPSKKKLADRR